MKVYRVHWGDRLMVGISLAFLTILPIILLALSLREAAAEEIPWIPFLPISLIGAWFFYVEVMCVPYEVEVREDRRIVLRSMVRETVVDPQEITSAKPGFFTRNYLKLRFRSGSLNLSKRMGGLDELLTTLKALNPQIETKG